MTLVRHFFAALLLVASLLSLADAPASAVPTAITTAITTALDTADDYQELRGLQLAPLMTAQECKTRLAVDKSFSASELDSSSIKILNWNIKKGEESGWVDDLEHFASGKQLIILQEAAMSMRLSAELQQTPFAAFSPGYIQSGDITGVVTFSEVEPIVHCRLSAMEPWLGTPKSTNVARYALSNSEQDLIVVNIHAVNFSFGLVSYRAQLDAIADVLSDHEGPVILSGDLNTWRSGRKEALLEYVAALGLEAVGFSQDNRKEVFGMPLDHIFARGLTVEESAAFDVSSSDHNPMVVSFALNNAAIQRSLVGL